MYENNEFSLYKIHSELGKVDSDALIIPVLSSIMDTLAFKRCLQSNEIHTVYHAAAYKHVPIVEHNLSEGVKNNVFGTLIVAEASLKACVENFVFISTDKAVRPTNIMGASKRLSELCLQGIYHHMYIYNPDVLGSGYPEEETMEFKKGTKLDYHKHIRSHIDYICPRSGRTAHIPKSLECYE